MRSGFTIVLIATLMFAGGYFYNLAQAVCPIPITYRLGELDERFGISSDEALLAIAEAAEVWETATGQNLFTYDEDGDLVINFLFDDRQALTNAEENFRDRLNAAENVNEAIKSTYEELVEEYETLNASYDERVTSFEARLARYNETVARYNEEGGAPSDVYDELEREKVALATEREELNAVLQQLNTLVTQINDIGERGNLLVETYNRGVNEYNEQFGEEREFTQGDYQGDRINIYTFKDKAELATVLAHELGHALSIDHVEGSASVMYYLIGEQPDDLALSESDVAEFRRICGDMNLWDKIVYRLQGN